MTTTGVKGHAFPLLGDIVRITGFSGLWQVGWIRTKGGRTYYDLHPVTDDCNSEYPVLASESWLKPLAPLEQLALQLDS